MCNYIGVQLYSSADGLGFIHIFLLCLRYLLKVLQLWVGPFLLDSCTKVATLLYIVHRCNLLPLIDTKKLKHLAHVLLICMWAVGKGRKCTSSLIFHHIKKCQRTRSSYN